MVKFFLIILLMTVLSLSSAGAAFKCSDQSYKLTLSESRPGIPPSISVSPSLIHGGGTSVGTYRYKLTYPLWSDRSKNKNEFIQPDVFGGFVSIEGWGRQRVELLCTDASGKNPDVATYRTISNTVSWESKKGDFKNSLKEGDLVEQYPTTGGRILFEYKSGKLVPIEMSADLKNQFYYDNLNKFIRAPVQVITPIALTAEVSQQSNDGSSSSTKEVSVIDSNALACSSEKKNKIKKRYQETAIVLDLLYKQKKKEMGCD